MDRSDYRALRHCWSSRPWLRLRTVQTGRKCDHPDTNSQATHHSCIDLVHLLSRWFILHPHLLRAYMVSSYQRSVGYQVWHHDFANDTESGHCVHHGWRRCDCARLLRTLYHSVYGLHVDWSRTAQHMAARHESFHVDRLSIHIRPWRRVRHAATVSARLQPLDWLCSLLTLPHQHYCCSDGPQARRCTHRDYNHHLHSVPWRGTVHRRGTEHVQQPTYFKLDQ